MNNLITLLVTVLILSSCGGGDKPKPPAPKVMKFTVRGKTFKVKAELTDKAKYTAEELKTRLAKKYAELDNK
ncbi:MAG TPA: hypothetical protein P5523_03695 [Bacteroidales bacterium]|nr:hypothetical protein [Bacteroidales bacterium]